jgi:hypothetical protein
VDECRSLDGGGAGAAPNQPGEVVQVDPIKPTFKAPGTKRLNLNYDKLLSSFAFKFNLRRTSLDSERSSLELAETRIEAALTAGAYTSPLFQLALSTS